MDPHDKKKGDDILYWMASLSCSYSQTNFERNVTHLKNVLKQSHIGCQQYANNMTSFSESNFLEQFKD